MCCLQSPGGACRCPPLPRSAPGHCLIAHEKQAYFWLERPEAADFGFRCE